MSHAFQVNLGGLIDVLSGHLYTRPEVFLRELIQNSVDALTARSGIDGSPAEPIRLRRFEVDGRPGLRISDHGSGLTEAEIHQFLATIGDSSKRNTELSDTFLGRFGIGLLSAFMVSDEILLETRSARPGSPALKWIGRADGTYAIEPGDESHPVGTTVTLLARPGREELFSSDAILRAVTKYAQFLPWNILVDDRPMTRPFPWDQAFQPSREELTRFARGMLGGEFLDAFVIHSSRYGYSGVAAIRAERSAVGSPPRHRVYLRGMLVTDTCPNLVPDWAFFLRVVVDATNLSPTASREEIRDDAALYALRDDIGRAARDWLVELGRERPAELGRIVSLHLDALLGLMMRDDDALRLFANWIPLETTSGNLTLGEYLAESSRLMIVPNHHQFNQLAPIARSSGLLVINAGHGLVRRVLERISRVRPDVVTEIVDETTFGRVLDEPSENQLQDGAKLVAIGARIFAGLGVEVVLKSFTPKSLPVLLVATPDLGIRRAIGRTRAEANALLNSILESVQADLPPIPPSELYLNVSNPIIRDLMNGGPDPVLEAALRTLHIQALLFAKFELTDVELARLSNGLGDLIRHGLSATTDGGEN